MIHGEFIGGSAHGQRRWIERCSAYRVPVFPSAAVWTAEDEEIPLDLHVRTETYVIELRGVCSFVAVYQENQ